MCSTWFGLFLSGAAALVIACAASGTGACSAAGYASNAFDIAPRHADVIWGISNTFGTVPGIVGIFITGWFVDRTGSFAAPFLLTAGFSLLGAIAFLVFGSGARRID